MRVRRRERHVAVQALRQGPLQPAVDHVVIQSGATLAREAGREEARGAVVGVPVADAGREDHVGRDVRHDPPEEPRERPARVRRVLLHDAVVGYAVHAGVRAAVRREVVLRVDLREAPVGEAQEEHVVTRHAENGGGAPRLGHADPPEPQVVLRAGEAARARRHHLPGEAVAAREEHDVHLPAPRVPRLDDAGRRERLVVRVGGDDQQPPRRDRRDRELLRGALHALHDHAPGGQPRPAVHGSPRQERRRRERQRGVTALQLGSKRGRERGDTRLHERS